MEEIRSTRRFVFICSAPRVGFFLFFFFFTSQRARTEKSILCYFSVQQAGRQRPTVCRPAADPCRASGITTAPRRARARIVMLLRLLLLASVYFALPPVFFCFVSACIFLGRQFFFVPSETTRWRAFYFEWQQFVCLLAFFFYLSLYYFIFTSIGVHLRCDSSVDAVDAERN